MRLFTAAVVIIASTFLPHLASAQTYLINTGTPTGGLFSESDSVQSFAAKFNIQTGQTITSIAPYLTKGNGQVGESFTLDIYTTLPARNNAGVLDYSVSGQYQADGFNSVTANWTASTTGNYWAALVNPNSAANFLDLETLSSASTGSPAALGFEYAGSTGTYTTSGAPSFGLEIVATPEPTSWALGLVCAGVLGGMFLLRRASARA